MMLTKDDFDYKRCYLETYIIMTRYGVVMLVGVHLILLETMLSVSAHQKQGRSGLHYANGIVLLITRPQRIMMLSQLIILEYLLYTNGIRIHSC